MSRVSNNRQGREGSRRSNVSFFSARKERERERKRETHLLGRLRPPGYQERCIYATVFACELTRARPSKGGFLNKLFSIGQERVRTVVSERTADARAVHEHATRARAYRVSFSLFSPNDHITPFFMRARMWKLWDHVHARSPRHV